MTDFVLPTDKETLVFLNGLEGKSEAAKLEEAKKFIEDAVMNAQIHRMLMESVSPTAHFFRVQ